MASIDYISVPSTLLEEIRKEDAEFFKERGLEKFLLLEWDLVVKKSAVHEFIFNYNVQTMATKVAGQHLSITPDLITEVFGLKTGPHRMLPRSTKKVGSEMFPMKRKGVHDKGFLPEQCRNADWKRRFLFLHCLIALRTPGRWMSHCYTEFVMSEVDNHDWVGAYIKFFSQEMERVQSTKQRVTMTMLGAPISLILEHMNAQVNLLNEEHGEEMKVNVEHGEEVLAATIGNGDLPTAVGGNNAGSFKDHIEAINNLHNDLEQIVGQLIDENEELKSQIRELKEKLTAAEDLVNKDKEKGRQREEKLQEKLREFKVRRLQIGTTLKDVE